jgi:hypothetical protein
VTRNSPPQHRIIQEVRSFEIPKDAKFYQVTL